MSKPSFVDLCTAPSKLKAVFSGLLTGAFTAASADQVGGVPAGQIVWGIPLVYITATTAVLSGIWMLICILRSIPWLWEKACAIANWVAGVTKRVFLALKE